MMILLESVGTFINTKTAMTHPARNNGTPDLYEGAAVHIEDIAEEWMNNLSSDDIEILEKEGIL